MQLYLTNKNVFSFYLVPNQYITVSYVQVKYYFFILILFWRYTSVSYLARASMFWKIALYWKIYFFIFRQTGIGLHLSVVLLQLETCCPNFTRDFWNCKKCYFNPHVSGPTLLLLWIRSTIWKIQLCFWPCLK